MKLFADTANLTDIESALKKGFIQGITTNPSLLAKEPKGSFESHIGQIVELIKTHKNGIHLSVEVFSRNLDEIIRQAQAKGALDTLDADPAKVVSMTRALLDKSYPSVKIIAGSIRKATDVRDAGLAGAHIVTVPPKFFPQMALHFKTDEVVEQFLNNFKKWLS